MRKIYLIMGLACLGLGVLAGAQGGVERLLLGLYQGFSMLLRLSPLLLLAFATAGLMTVLIPEEKVSRWLGQESGWKGLLLGGLAGALVPGGPFIYFPIAASFLVSGAEIGTVVCFVTAKNLWSLSRLPIEIALLGVELTFIRYAATAVFPPLVGLAANQLFSGSIESIRREILELQGRRRKK
ncbi:MAG: permease [Desulfohalobiaceae bacterium]|nr:permease [Desulfohalobiaceae bacterium]